MDVITADIGRSLVPDSLQVPKDSDSGDDDDDDDGDDDDVVVQEIGSDIDDRGDFDEVYDKIEDEGEAVVEEEEEEEEEEESITTLLQAYNMNWSNLQDMEGESKRFGFFMTEREISKFLFNH